jgi:hypothetical protein
MVAVLSGIALLLFSMLCLLAMFKTHWTLVLIFTVFAFEQLLESFIPFFATKSWVINVTTAGIAGVALMVSLITGKRPMKGFLNLNSALILSLYLFAAFGTLYSMSPEAGRYFLTKGSPYFVLYILMLPALVSNTEQISKMTTPFLFVGLIILILILASPRTLFYGTRMLIDLSYTRGSGEQGNPLALGELGGTMMIIAVLMEPERKNLLFSMLRIGALLVGLSVSFFVGSRGQLVFSLFVAVLCYPVAHEIKDVRQFFIRTASAGATLLLVALVAKTFLLGSEASARFSSESLTEGVNSRMYFITEMLNAWGSNPANYLQGLGTGAFNAIVPHGKDGFLYPHNLVIEILTHHGLIGFTLLSFIGLVTAVHGLRLVSLGRHGLINRGVVAIILAMTLYVTMISLKQGSFMLYPLPFYMCMVVSKLYSRTMSELKETGDIARWDDADSEYSEYEDYGDYDADESLAQTA